jgi:hypothetical protein
LDFLRILKMKFIILSLLMNKSHDFYDISFLVINCGKMFVGVIFVKPSRDFTCPLGIPRGLKGLLHTLNAIVFPTKEEVV